VHAKPHFIRCLRPNEQESSSEFRRGFVIQQVRSLQILETVNLMAGGFPHRMRFKNFNARYRSAQQQPTRRKMWGFFVDKKSNILLNSHIYIEDDQNRRRHLKNFNVLNMD
jgi:myosin heavy subunit